MKQQRIVRSTRAGVTGDQRWVVRLADVFFIMSFVLHSGRRCALLSRAQSSRFRMWQFGFDVREKTLIPPALPDLSFVLPASRNAGTTD